jgi:hypothetical protein
MISIPYGIQEDIRFSTLYLLPNADKNGSASLSRAWDNGVDGLFSADPQPRMRPLLSMSSKS